jgi:threonine dehydratase
MSTHLRAWPTPTLADVVAARRRIAPYLRPTPQIEYLALSEALGCRVILKLENLNPTAAFKVRGGVNLLAALDAQERSRGVLAVSTGNHAQSVAYAARLFGAPATIFMPAVANPVKLAAVKAQGARVIQVGRDFDEARAACERYAATGGLRYIHSSNEPLLIAGVGTYALELLEEFPAIDALLVPLGGGSGALGAGVVARAMSPSTRVIGVQAEGAPAVYLSWKQGRYVETERVDTFAEGLATRQPFELPRQLLPRLVDEIMLVSDSELEQAIRLLLATSSQVAEGAGAAGVAAAWKRRFLLQGRTLGIILSGGNLPPDQLRRILDASPALTERAREPEHG